MTSFFVQKNGCLSTNQSVIKEAPTVFSRIPSLRWLIGHSSITNFLTLSPFESLYVLMLLDKNLIFAFFLLFRRLQSCGPGNGGGRTWLWLHQCLICRCKFPFPIFQCMMPYFDDIFWALKQNLQKNIVFLSYLNVSFRFRFFNNALFWRYFFSSTNSNTTSLNFLEFLEQLE